MFPAFDAVVLAGGNSTRLGRDKVLERVGGVRLLDRVLAAVSAARSTVVVGAERPGVDGVTWTREQPPGGGPVAALAAGLALVDADVVVLLAADLPFVSQMHVERLLAALDGSATGALFVDDGGRDQPLASAWRVAALRAVLPPEPAGHGLRRVLAPMPVVRLDGGQDLVDCDTEPELSEARRRADTRPAEQEERRVNVLDQWVADVVSALGLDPSGYDRDLLLDLTRDVAHGVARPAAPLTAYLAGLAAGRDGGDRAALEAAVARITALLPPTGEEPVS